MKDLMNKIDQINSLISLEEKSMGSIPDFLMESIAPKKKSVVESLKKQKAKCEAELAKLQAIEEKERREAPLKKLMSEINSIKKSLTEKQNELMRAKNMATQNPKDSSTIVRQIELASETGDLSRELYKLTAQQKELKGSVNE